MVTATPAPDARKRGRSLIINKLHKEYRAGQPVLRDVSLEIESRGLVAIIGPSGTGKSTLIRICTSLDTTETFKQKKQELMRDGFDPHQVTDPLFFREPRSGEYRPIDALAYARLLDGSIRL